MPVENWKISQMKVAAQFRRLNFQVLEEIQISSGRIDVLAHKRTKSSQLLVICEVKDYKRFAVSQEKNALNQLLKYVTRLSETGTGYKPNKQTKIAALIVTTNDTTIVQKELTNLMEKRQLEDVQEKVASFKAFIVKSNRIEKLLKSLNFITSERKLEEWTKRSTEV